MKRARPDGIGTLFEEGRKQPLFLRLNGCSPEFEPTLMQIFDLARNNGVILDGNIPNPTAQNLDYYNETMGQDFRMEPDFISAALRKWLPRMNAAQQQLIAQALTDMLLQMRAGGKTDSMLRNAYMRFMCWLYFKFERVAVRLGEGKFPTVLYQGKLTNFELSFLTILCSAGCDVVALQTGGESEYQKLDPKGEMSDLIPIPGEKPFPADFGLMKMYKEKQEQLRRSAAPRPAPAPAQRASPVPLQRPATASRPMPAPGGRPGPDWQLALPEADFIICPNIWMKNDPLESIHLPAVKRGEEPKHIYTCFVRRDGVDSKVSYPTELMQLHQRLLENGRKVLIVDDGFPAPTADEVSQIRRRNSYTGVNDAITDLAANLRTGTVVELQNTAVRAFMELMKEEAEKPGANAQRIASTAAYVLCWFRQCYQKLFSGWKPPQVGCLIYLGPCRSEREALFLRFLSKLPVDLVLLCPNLDKPGIVSDPLLFVQSFDESLNLTRFPREGASMRINTAASHAEQELDSLLYNNSGLYRNRQFDLAQSLMLDSTSDEVKLYWDQELKYRPGFNTVNGTVMMPVLFAQMSGVRNGNVNAYWQEIKQLITPDTIVLRKLPYFDRSDVNAAAGNPAEFLRNGKLQRARLKEHRSYPFGFLREETQEHILNKLQLMIDQKLIKGTFEHGVEYQIVTVVLSMKKEWLRMIQKFDFTKKNPKLLCIHTSETMPSREDAILLAFMSLIGFDVVGFVPTGYQWVSQWYNESLVVDHQIGDYVYDLTVPDFNTISLNTHSVWNFFRRGS